MLAPMQNVLFEPFKGWYKHRYGDEPSKSDDKPPPPSPEEADHNGQSAQKAD
jgi:hypothetical protein